MMKKLAGMTALLLALGLVFMGCPTDPPDDTQTGNIDWTLEADGTGSNSTGATDTTQITITFKRNPSGLLPQNINIVGGPAELKSKESSSTSTKWVFGVEVSGSGNISVKIDRKGIVAGPKTVMVWKEGAAVKNGYTAVAVDGAQNTATTTKIKLTFDENVTGLSVNDIAINTTGQTGNATKGVLNGTDGGKVYELGITVATQGKIQIIITKDGIDSGPRTVDVYLNTAAGIVIPPDGNDGNSEWTLLEVDHSDTDPSKQTDNETYGKGVITGEDFAAIVDATGYKGTFLRLYIEIVGTGSYPGGALGNKKNAQGVVDGGLNLKFDKPASGYVVDLTLKDLKKYYEETDNEIFVNAWDGAKVVGIQLWVPMNLEPEVALPDGYYEITLPTTDGVSGKGFLGAVDMAAINAAGPNAYLEIHGVHGNNTWANLIYNDSWTAVNGLAVFEGSGIFLEEITIAEIRSLVEATEGAALQAIGFNIYNGGYFTEMYLVDPDAMDPNAPIPYTALADGGARKTSSKITFNFVRDVTSLADTDITITNGTGSVTKGALTGSNKTWDLAITVVTAGNVSVQIPNRADINSDARPVVVYFVLPVTVPPDGSDEDYTWTNLEIDTSGAAGDPEVGKGIITGDDFDAIVDAKQWKDTFLRVYLDLSDAGSYPGGALGNKKNASDVIEGTLNLQFSAPATGDYVDLTLKDLKKYFEDEDESIFVNAWNGAKIVGILLFVPNDQEPESTLPDGVTEISLPAGDTPPGKGSLGSVDVAAINNAAPGAYLEFYFLGGTKPQGEGIGAIGPSWSGDDCVSIIATNTGDFVAIVTIDALRAKYTDGTINTIILNIWDCDGLEKLWLREPVVTELTLPSGETIPGKGNLENADLAKIKQAKEGAFIKVYISGATQNGGIGEFVQYENGEKVAPDKVPSITISASGDQIATVMVADILAYFVATETDTWLMLNVWNCDAVTKLELVEP